MVTKDKQKQKDEKKKDNKGDKKNKEKEDNKKSEKKKKQKDDPKNKKDDKKKGTAKSDKKVEEYKKNDAATSSKPKKEEKAVIVTVKGLPNKEFENLKTSLFVKTMKHDLVLVNEYEDTLEERIARLLTNDMGETLRTEVSYVLIQEFKKFMYIVALEILQRKHDKSFDKNSLSEDKAKKTLYFTSPYHPPYMIDLVWRFIIQEGKIYEDFWNLLWGGYIDRINPNKDLKATLSRYTAGRLILEKNDKLIKPYWGLWPKIENTDQIALDYEYDMLFHMNEKLAMLVEFREDIQEAEVDDFDLRSIKTAIQDWREKHLVEIEEFEERELAEEPDLESFNIKKNKDIHKLYQKLIEYQFHEKFNKSISFMFLLEETAGQQLIREYKNFLFMYYLTDKRWAPSFEIDSFWDLHYASTKEYREFCLEIFGEFLPSKNYDYNEKGIRKRAQDYKLSLRLYEELFGDEPNEVFWESVVDLVINSKNGFQHVSLFKYASLWIYHIVNGDLEYKNTIRRSKDEYYKKFKDEEIDRINRLNDLRITAATGLADYERITRKRVVDDGNL